MYFDFRSRNARSLITTFQRAISFIDNIKRDSDVVDVFMACDDDQYNDDKAKEFLEHIKGLNKNYMIIHVRDDLCDHFIIMKRMAI